MRFLPQKIVKFLEFSKSLLIDFKDVTFQLSKRFCSATGNREQTKK